MSEPSLKKYIKALKLSSLERKIPNISEENAEFIQSLIREKKPKHILEIGTANGYSALCFYEALSKTNEEDFQKGEVRSGEDVSKFREFSITTIEYAVNAHSEAIEHFSKMKVKNIHAISGDAKKVLPGLADEYFDFLFIDGMKREYLDYLLLALPKLTLDAMIVIDDVEKFRNKMENLYTFLEKNLVPYTIEKTDKDDSIMIIKASSGIKNLHSKLKDI